MTIIWILLGAVVLIIVVLAVLFRLFLRADDVDPFDEIPDEPRRPARPREPAMAAAPRSGPVRKALPADRPRPGAGYSDRGSPPSKRDSAPRPAPARQDRQAVTAAKATEWEKMSDVDYWTELAADKPLADTGAGELTGPRQPRRRVPESRPASSEGPPADLPTRQRRASSVSGPRPTEQGSQRPHAPRRYAGPAEPAAQSVAALARLGGQPRQWPDGFPPPSRPEVAPQAPAARTGPVRSLRPEPSLPPSQPRHAARAAQPEPLDDDPLTSPSFPAINTSDSRSYRTRRADTDPGRVPASPDFAGYPAPVSPPNGYPLQPAAAAGNPYGSFVGQPVPSYQAAGPAHHETGYPGYAQPVPQSQNWSGARGSRSAYATVPPTAPHPANGQHPVGHPPAQNGYAAAPYDQSGYAEPGYDGYQGYPGYPSGGY